MKKHKIIKRETEEEYFERMIVEENQRLKEIIGKKGYDETKKKIERQRGWGVV